MTSTIPEWLRDDDIDTDRALLAAWLYLRGDDDAYAVLVRSVRGQQPLSVDWMRYADEFAELLGIHDRLSDGCASDVRDVAYTVYGDRVPAGSWREYADRAIEDLHAELIALGRKFAHPVAAVAS